MTDANTIQVNGKSEKAKKRKPRRTQVEMERLRQLMVDFCTEHNPLSVRNLYYLMAQAQHIPKDDEGYDFVKRESGKLRENGRIPFEWLRDESRHVIQNYLCDDLEHALTDTVAQYKRNLWLDQPVYVEVWCEAKSSIATLSPLVAEWHVRLVPLGGFTSKTLMWNCAQHLRGIGKPVHLIYLGDYDPSGMEIEADISTRIHRYAPDVDLTVTRVALTAEQVVEWNLPPRPPKDGAEKLAAKWGLDTVAELEAIPPNQLRKLCREAIRGLVDLDILEACRNQEVKDLAKLEAWVAEVME